MRRRRPVGVAPDAPVAHVRALLRRAVHADRACAHARGARGTVGEDCSCQGRIGGTRHSLARAAKRDRADRDDGGDGCGHGDRGRHVRRDGLRPAGARQDDDPCARRPAGLRLTRDSRDHPRLRVGDHRAQPDRRPGAAGDRPDSRQALPDRHAPGSPDVPCEDPDRLADVSGAGRPRPRCVRRAAGAGASRSRPRGRARRPRPACGRESALPRACGGACGLRPRRTSCGRTSWCRPGCSRPRSTHRSWSPRTAATCATSAPCRASRG